jgi:RimJ/RimL family protein N-acetyltransferase
VSKMHGFATIQPIEMVELVKPLPNSWDRNATFRRKFWGALGIRAVRFKPVLVDKELRLRICRFWDLARLKTRFDPGLFLQAAGSEARPFRSLFSFRKWLKSAFDLFYLIEIQKHGRQRITGFVGFYGVRAQEHLWMSLAIFDANDRRRGYGARAVELVCEFLQHETRIKRIRVEVAKRNHASLSFFQACSFRQAGETAPQ